MAEKMEAARWVPDPESLAVPDPEHQETQVDLKVPAGPEAQVEVLADLEAAVPESRAET